MRLQIISVVLAVLTSGCAVSPEPLSDAQFADYAVDKNERVVADQEPLQGALTLYEAMARALKYNLDKEVEVMEIKLRQRQLAVAHYSMLPNIVAGAGYDDRNNYSGGNSVELLGPNATGDESLRSSTSSEKDVRMSDLRFSWNILDFGLSYVRAQQSADQVLVAEESRRRVVNRIVENVRTAYWRAVSATRLVDRLSKLEERVSHALNNTQSLVAKGESSPLTALTYERELVEIQRELRRLNGELSTAKAQLAALINVDPGQTYSVVVPKDMLEPSDVNLDPEDMVSRALANRSELREMAYQQRINVHEAEAAILEMLPGISLNAGPAWNSNAFLYNSNWVAWGAQASWNLMKVLSYPERQAEVEAKDGLLDQRALAVTMAIMAQVHVGRARLIHARREYRTAVHFQEVQIKILDQIRAALKSGSISEQTAIREEMNALVALVKRDMAYAELQSAFAAVHASMGATPYSDVDNSTSSVNELREALQVKWAGLGERSR